ncbi:MAG: hypothetical protein RIR02_272, partial [Pseudomonadota bacterium]
MQNFLARIEKLQSKHLYFILIAFSAILAARIQYIQHGWINPDTVLYFESARLIALGDFKEAVKVFNWPLYSLCMAGVHKLTTLSIHHSAQVLSIVFFAITTVSFVKIIELGGGNKKTMLAGALILFSSLYIVGDVLEMLMRDQGFWACFLSSLVFFIRFKNNNQYRDAFLWQIFAILATLFRIEAIMYLLFLPVLLLLETKDSWHQKIAHFIKCNFLNIIAGLGIILALSLSNHLSMKHFGRLQEVFSSKLFDELTHNLLTKGQIMSEQVLGKYLEEFAVIGLLLTFIYVMIVKAISTTGIINFALVVYSRAQKRLISEPNYGVLKVTALIALLNMALIITKVFVLSSRYVVPLAFVMMIVAAFQLGKMLTEYSQGKMKQPAKKLALCLILLFMLGSIIKNIWPKAEGYNFIKDSISWMSNENKDAQKVYFQDARMRYFANTPPYTSDSFGWPSFQQKFLNGSITEYHYLMISINRKHPDQEKW